MKIPSFVYAILDILGWLLWVIAYPLIYIMKTAANIAMNEDSKPDNQYQEPAKCCVCDAPLDGTNMVTRYHHYFCSLECLFVWEDKYKGGVE